MPLQRDGGCRRCKAIARATAWNRTNKARRREISSAWDERNREYKLAYAKAWRAANPSYTREWRAAHPEHREVAVAGKRRWRIANYERYMAADRAWKAANRERLREQARRRYRANPAPRMVTEAARRARKKGVVATLTVEEWQGILARFGHRCAYCGVGGPMVQEHMTPLSRGGTHSADNVAPACAPCNRRKHTMTAEEFLAATHPSS